jgi:hypothetical protein
LNLFIIVYKNWSNVDLDRHYELMICGVGLNSRKDIQTLKWVSDWRRWEVFKNSVSIFDLSFNEGFSMWFVDHRLILITRWWCEGRIWARYGTRVICFSHFYFQYLNLKKKNLIIKNYLLLFNIYKSVYLLILLNTTNLMYANYPL